MIAIALIATMLGTPKTVEIPVNGSGIVIAQVYAPAPENMSDREAAAWHVMADALFDGTEEFSRDKLSGYASQAGEPLTIEAFPDYIRIQVVEPVGGLKVASLIVESLIMRGSLTEEAVLASRTRLKLQRRDSWSQALLDQDLPFDKVTPELVKKLYLQTFRPDRVVFVFGGEFLSGDGQNEIAQRYVKVPALAPRRALFEQAPRTWTHHNDPVTTFEWRSSALSPGKVEDVSKILATFALGVGKGSSMHRVLREQLGWSYRQEAVFWPSQKGWVPRLIFARTASLADPAQIGEAAEALKKDVATWDEASLVRARAMLASSVAGTNPLCPFWTTLNGPMTSSLFDKCSWSGLNAMMAGYAFDTTDLISKAKDVKLDEIKAAATRLLDDSQASVIPGR